MFKTPEPLSPDRHRRLRLASTPDYRFAAHEVVAPFVSGEMWQIAREYITVFSKQLDELPLAILGTEAGVNGYVGDGNPPWWGRYVPAHLRRYPFILAPRTATPDDAKGDQRFTLYIDTAAPQLNETEGRPLFKEDGQLAELLQEVQQALLGLQQDFALTQSLVKQIDAAGLLVEQALTVKRQGREPVALTGFRIIDQAKLRTCPPELLSSLAKSRALDLIYAHIGSLTNAQDGLLAKKASGQRPSALLQDVDIDALLNSGDGTLKLNF